ncbi:MAG: aromatic ring-hydroxylating dioxygenase subunit alpha [Rudaea sp.]|nr:aromatic ring-hydroxylating dioxygenase subunit alpha [Rudaea sp.]
MKKRSSRGQHTLAREYFVSNDIFAAEHERIFLRSWLLAGHVSQLQEPGSYFLFEIEHESVIVLRDGAGEIRAFHNHCRHRGSRLCRETSGVLGAAIQCPYHAWSYGLDGALRNVPMMNDVAGFDAADYPLHRVALTNWQGFLFVNLADQPLAFADALPGLAGRFGAWQPSELRAVHREVYDVEANWKMFFHNFSECYHCPLAHPVLNKLAPFRNSENDLEEGPVLGGPMWMNNSEGSMTIGGERCAPAFAGLNDEQRGRVYYYTLFPGAFLSFHPDYVLVHRVQPLAIGRTRIVCEWFFHPSAIATPGFDPQPAIALWDMTNRQDWELCVNAYRGVVSRVWRAGPYSELESQLAAFDRQYLRALGIGSESQNIPLRMV